MYLNCTVYLKLDQVPWTGLCTLNWAVTLNWTVYLGLDHVPWTGLGTLDWTVYTELDCLPWTGSYNLELDCVAWTGHMVPLTSDRTHDTLNRTWYFSSYLTTLTSPYTTFIIPHESWYLTLPNVTYQTWQYPLPHQTSDVGTPVGHRYLRAGWSRKDTRTKTKLGRLLIYSWCWIVTRTHARCGFLGCGCSSRFLMHGS